MPTFLPGDRFEAWTAASAMTICLKIICDVSRRCDPVDGHNTSTPDTGKDRILALRPPET